MQIYGNVNAPSVEQDKHETVKKKKKKKRKQKVSLIIDNRTAHPDICGLKTICLLFLHCMLLSCHVRVSE